MKTKVKDACSALGLHSSPPNKRNPTKWEQRVGGRYVVMEGKRHSRIFCNSVETTGWGLLWARPCGCGPGFVRPPSAATSELPAICNAIRTARGGIPLGFRRNCHRGAAQGRAVSDVRRHTVTNSYGCGNGHFWNGCFRPPLRRSGCVLQGVAPFFVLKSLICE